MKSRVFVVFVMGGCIAIASAQTTPSPERAAVTRYCTACHNSKVKTGGLALDAAEVHNPAANSEAWEKVVKKLRTRSMPPAGLPRPDERTYTALLTSLESSLDTAATAKPNPGRTDTFRRLNRTEYRNAIRDLLAMEVEVSSLLPSDESSHGFDNVTVGDLSPTLLERYLSAARKISRLAMGSPARSPGGDTITLPPDLTQEDHFEELPLGTRGGSTVRYNFPLDAKYDIQIRLARDRNEHVEGLKEPSDVELMLDGERVQMFTVVPPPPGKDHSLVDKDLTVRVPVKAGPHVLAVAFPRKAAPLLETERQPWHAHFNMDRHPRLQPALYSVSINGPYEAKGAGDTPSRRRILVCKEQDDSCAKRVLTTLMRRAYRRPITEADVQIPFKFYKEARTESGFNAGIEMGLSAVLVSPEFLFRVEQDPPGVAPHTPYRVSDVELASRLSFFLWSSIPDDELLDTAIQGKLRTPAVLEQQVRRMLADSRSQALVSNFAEQWLYLRNLASTTPDMRLFPDFDDNLRQAFRKETELFFESIMREDRSVLDLLRANYTFVNERLAKHYGIPNVYGSRFRRITFPEGSVRGGLLRQGSVLTVTSYATRTSPVIRGKWILDNVLGVPPPPPPPDVPALKENSGGGGKNLSIRERMAEHRKNPVCSGCHQLMDPVGFSLENYDAVGRWRTVDDGKPIDVAGSLPDGSKFDGASGLQKALLSRPENFATTLTEKLLTYGLGRGVENYDAPAVRKIVKTAGNSDFRFSSFILGIVNSTPFQMRRSQ
jgi:Protein of unknown function (DUF1592)/Protein of unknown function (DUF1588)/Protein of unknown function (DUF1585)/Protein of unknown function (DUF1587)/Protein of unknown function (DUF1595)/Planctomycete cytochrome C